MVAQAWALALADGAAAAHWAVGLVLFLVLHLLDARSQPDVVDRHVSFSLALRDVRALPPNRRGRVVHVVGYSLVPVTLRRPLDSTLLRSLMVLEAVVSGSGRVLHVVAPVLVSHNFAGGLE